MPVAIALLLSIIVLLLLSAYTSGAEAALFSLPRVQLHAMEEHPDRAARRVLRLLRDPERLLSTLLVTNDLVNIGLSSLATAFCLLVVADTQRAVEIAFVSATLVVLFVGEITPKTLAVNFPAGAARFVSGGMLVLHAVLRPFTAALRGLAGVLLRPLGATGGAPARGARLSRAELRAVLEEVEPEGASITPSESRLVQNILEFPRRTAEEVMTPRVDIVDLEVDTPPAAAIRRMRETRHSRYPVYAGEPDRVLGFVPAKEFLLHPQRGLRELLRPVIYFPETAPVDRIFHEIQRSRTAMAIVVDEYGEVAGLITREDVIEEIVGDIYDEFDLEEAPIRRKGEGLFILPGRLALQDLNQGLGLDLPDAAAVTLNGFLCDVHGRIPRPGTVVAWRDLRFHILEVARHQVRRVLLELPGPDEPGREAP